MPAVESLRLRTRARVAGAASTLALSLFCAADIATAQSRVRVPADCGSEGEFARELERLLGAEWSRAWPQSVVIQRSAQTEDFELAIVLRDGSRGLRHADCRTLFRSAVVVAAASYRDEQRRLRAEATPPSPGVAEPGNAATADEEKGSADPGDAPIELRLAAGFGAAAGPLPEVAPLVELVFGASRETFGLSLAVRYLTGTDEHAASGHGVFVTGLGARALATFEPWKPLRAGLGLGVYRLNGEGRGTPEPLSDVAVSVAPGLELAALPLRTESLELELVLGGHWAVVRPRFIIQGFGEVFRVPTLGGEGLIRLGWRIP